MNSPNSQTANQQLDADILKAMGEGERHFHRINASVGGIHTFRKVDRRLQALRKRGLIAFNKKEWSLK